MDEKARAQLEIQNGLRQYDAGLAIIGQYLDRERPFALRPSLLQQLQGIAVDGLEPKPGEFRETAVSIEKSRHQPPPPHLVKSLVVEMCEYVNDNLHDHSGFHLAAYVMWRHNWIHPFSDGNGRTSRVLSYVVLSLKLGYILPGSPTIPQQIQEDRTGYFAALEAADAAWEAGDLDVRVMENLIRNMLANQLLSVIEEAQGGPIQ